MPKALGLGNETGKKSLYGEKDDPTKLCIMT